MSRQHRINHVRKIMAAKAEKLSQNEGDNNEGTDSKGPVYQGQPGSKAGGPKGRKKGSAKA